MKRFAFFTYGVVCYSIGVVALLYLAGFIGNFGVPKTIDGPASSPLWKALLVNLGLVALFGVQHSVMARPTFKQWWTRFVPRPIERSTYVVASAVACFALFYYWQPTGGVVWHVTDPLGRAALYALYAAGWVGVFVTTFLINHFDLFGLQQVWLYLRGKGNRESRFVTPGPYRVVRHPLYVGWLTVMWATPTMTAAHLVLALGMTAYILVAIYFEERNLVQFHPEYAEYRRRVPMLVPRWTRARGRIIEPARTTSTAA
jgi:protein-S-isoprenylcysteine O-methyltransferase Ste14